jgi:hypothetical protein
MSHQETISKDEFAAKIQAVSKLPEPAATGNDKIAILNHKLSYIDTSRIGAGAKPFFCIEFAIRNISESIMAIITFEAIFYDAQGNIADTVKHTELHLRPNTSRGCNIISWQDPDKIKIKSYNLKVKRAITADIEKVQICNQMIKTTAEGEDISGIVKNISESKTDAALVANFVDSNNEKIGSKVIILRDIEANSVRQFHFIFKPQSGDMVRTYSLNVVCDIEDK